MFTLILYLLYAVSAQISSRSTLPVYSRIYLHGLKKFENKRMLTKFINNNFWYYIGNYFDEDICKNLDKDVCENIINGIYTLISERFPDSEIIYDANTKQYTVKYFG